MFKNNFFRKVCITQLIFLIIICKSSNYSDFVVKHTGFLLALIFLIPYEFIFAKDIRQLQQENKELKRNCNIGNENLSFYIQENKELHNKIDKAIEYLVNPVEKIWEGHSIDEVVRILKGDVDE